MLQDPSNSPRSTPIPPGAPQVPQEHPKSHRTILWTTRTPPRTHKEQFKVLQEHLMVLQDVPGPPGAP